SAAHVRPKRTRARHADVGDAPLIFEVPHPPAWTAIWLSTGSTGSSAVQTSRYVRHCGGSLPLPPIFERGACMPRCSELSVRYLPSLSHEVVPDDLVVPCPLGH